MTETKDTNSQTADRIAHVAANAESGGQDASVPVQRLLSLDAYRGLIMIVLSTTGFGLAATARNQLERAPDSSFWTNVKYQFSHTEWVGCSFWDLILPSFMFMVGVAMAYSYAKRKRLGHSYGKMLRHAILRALVLVLLGVFLQSKRGPSTNWIFTNVLSMIGLGYVFVFLLWGRRFWIQLIAAVAVLAGTWLAFVLYPTTGINLETGNREVRVSAEWAQEHLADLSPAWHKNADVGRALDVWLLNLFPREKPFVASGGGYSTFMFVPSIAFMIFGLMCGELLQSKRRTGHKLLFLVAGGVLALAAGFGLDAIGVCPMIKRTVTPSFVLFASGWCLLMLACLYALIDVLQLRWLALPLAVVGTNSLLVYLMLQLVRPWTAEMLQIHLGQNVFEWLGPVYSSTVQCTMVGLVFWLVCYWLYRQKVFLRI